MYFTFSPNSNFEVVLGVTEAVVSLFRTTLVVYYFFQGLKKHLLYYKRANKENSLGFDLYEDLPAIRLKYLQAIAKK